MCYNSPLVRNKPLGAPAFVKLVYCHTGKFSIWKIYSIKLQQCCRIKYVISLRFQAYSTTPRVNPLRVGLTVSRACIVATGILDHFPPVLTSCPRKLIDGFGAIASKGQRCHQHPCIRWRKASWRQVIRTHRSDTNLRHGHPQHYFCPRWVYRFLCPWSLAIRCHIC